jgi:flagellin
MAGTVTLTAALRANLLSLQNTNVLMETAQFRLATGKKVNSALDNPASFFSAQSLTYRSDDLTSLLDGMGQAIQTLKATDNALNGITTLLRQAQSIATTAKDSAGTGTGGSFVTGDLSAADAASLTAAKVAANDAFTLTSGGNGAVTFTITAGMALATLAAAIDSHADFVANVETRVLNGATVSRLRVTAANVANALTFTNTVNTPAAALQATTVVGGTSGSTSAGLAITTGVAIAAVAGTPTDATLATQYDAVRTQINQLVADSGYRGVNLLNLQNLVVQFNEANTSSSTVTGVNMLTTGLLLLTAANFTSAATIQADLDRVSTALTTVRTQQKTFGNALSVIQNREDFTRNLVDVLKEGSSKLTLADKNEEGANLLSLQTSQQLGIQALSLASQANQSILRLFQ